MSWRRVPVPKRMEALPRDRAGRLVPQFVAYVDGEPDHRVVWPGAVEECVRWQSCWLCGSPLAAYRAFLVGPMCVVNRLSAEPPMHRDCAEYAARVCPFLTTPRRGRRESGMPDEVREGAGTMLKRNPGVVALWITKGTGYRLEREPEGILHRLTADPLEVVWIAEGRQATRAEVQESLSGGLPALRRLAAMDGPFAQLELNRALSAAMKLLPEEGLVPEWQL